MEDKKEYGHSVCQKCRTPMRSYHCEHCGGSTSDWIEGKDDLPDPDKALDGIENVDDVVAELEAALAKSEDGFI